MDDLTPIFEYEIDMQCRFVLFAVGYLNHIAAVEAEQRARLDELTEGISADEDEQEFILRAEKIRSATKEERALDLSRRTWFALQAILSAAANLSKLLWGSGRNPEAEERRAALRESLEVGDDSPLKSPRVRNQFEHIDEKLDGLEGRPYAGRTIGPIDSPFLDVGEPKFRFGHWDPETGVVTFWDYSISILEIVAEVERIHAIVRPRANPVE
jgi:hypothetical protein